MVMHRKAKSMLPGSNVVVKPGVQTFVKIA